MHMSIKSFASARLALFAVLVALVPLASFAQVQSQLPAVVTILPRDGSATTPHLVHVRNLSPEADQTVVLIDPQGGEQVVSAHTDALGEFEVTFNPPTVGWTTGMYRVVVKLPGGGAVSNTFVSNDGKSHLFAEPYLPSPTSAFMFVVTGVPPNINFRVLVSLTGGQEGQRELRATSDSVGLALVYVWPQQFGLPFFAAGSYQVQAPDLGLVTPFTVREHPSSATISAGGSPVAGSQDPVHLQLYHPGRYVWGIARGAPEGQITEFLAGPVDDRGTADASVQIPTDAATVAYIATPYDWGETTVQVVQPTVTSTPATTVTPTSDTARRTLRRSTNRLHIALAHRWTTSSSGRGTAVVDRM